MTQPILLPTEIWSIVYSFLSSSDRSKFEQVNLFFRAICIDEERREIRELWQLENKYLVNPLREEPVPEYKIQTIESKIGRKIPFHLREFIKLSDGRKERHTNGFSYHWSDGLNCFDDWYFEYTEVRIGLIQYQYESSEMIIELESGKLTSRASFQSKIIKEGFKGWLKKSILVMIDQFSPFDMDALCHPSNEKDLKILIKTHGYIYGQLPEKLKSDREIVKKALQSSKYVLQNTTKEIAQDEEIVRLACREHTRVQGLPEKYMKDKQFVMDYSIDLLEVHESLRYDTDVVKNFINKGGPIYQVPLQMLSDDLIIEAAKHQGDIGIVNWNLHNELVLKLLDIIFPKEGGLFASFLKENERKLSEKVLKKLALINPLFVLLNLHYDDVSLTKDQVIQYILAEGSSHRFESLPFKWRKDKVVAEVAMTCNFTNFTFLSEEMKEDMEFLIPIMKKTRVPETLLSDTQFVTCISQKEEYLRIVFSSNPTLLTVYPRKLDQTFIDSLDFGEVGCTIEILQKTRYERYCELYEAAQQVSIN